MNLDFILVPGPLVRGSSWEPTARQLRQADHSAAEARRRGWPVVRLQGTHLHPTLNPAETAGAIIAMSQQLVSRTG